MEKKLLLAGAFLFLFCIPFSKGQTSSELYILAGNDPRDEVVARELQLLLTDFKTLFQIEKVIPLLPESWEIVKPLDHAIYYENLDEGLRQLGEQLPPAGKPIIAFVFPTNSGPNVTDVSFQLNAYGLPVQVLSNDYYRSDLASLYENVAQPENLQLLAFDLGYVTSPIIAADTGFVVKRKVPRSTYAIITGGGIAAWTIWQILKKGPCETDQTGPVIGTNAGDLDFSCQPTAAEIDNWLDAHGGASATDPNGPVSWSHTYTGTEIPCNSSQEVIFTATDTCGNRSTTSALIRFFDTQGPEITQEAQDEVIICGSLTEFDAWLEGNGGASANDNCGVVTWTHDYDGSIPTCGQDLQVIFTVSDFCGNENTTEAVFRTEDLEKPQFDTPPADITVECLSLVPAPASLGWTDNCDGSGSAVPVDSVSPGSCPKTIYRSWQHTDSCGNAASVTQVITVDDNTPPQFGTPPADITVECFSLVPAPLNLSWTDNCDGSGSAVPADSISTGSCPRIIYRSWQHTDSCGNAASVMQVITVDDNTPPQFGTPPADITVECFSLVLAPDLSWTDNCDGGGSAVPTDSISTGSCPKTIYRSWQHTDSCGNAASVTQVITVDDNTPPQFGTPPADITVECFSLVPAPLNLSWTDNCDGSGSAVPADSISPGSCPKIIYRSWQHTDSCGNAARVTQVITVDDNTAPQIGTPPADITVECFSLVPAPLNLSWTDNCDGSGSAVPADSISPGSCPKTIYRSWQHTDSCGNAASVTQVITVDDNTPPQFGTPPADITVECFSLVPAPLNLSWTDNCDGSGSAVPTDSISPGSCPKTIYRSWQHTDSCGNAASVTQVITVDDNTAPQFGSPPADITVECFSLVPAPLNLSWTDNCDGSGSAVPTDSVSTGSCPKTIYRSWQHTDSCGNAASVTQVITVDDNTPPQFGSPQADIAVQCISLVPNPVPLTWTDNCDGSGSAVSTDSVSTGSCPKTIYRSWQHTDSCGNAASVTQVITVDDTVAPQLDPAPVDTTVQCISDVPALDSLNWSDNCDGNGTVMGTETSSGNCPLTIIRRWEYTDACGNLGYAEQIITVDDTVAPQITTPAQHVISYSTTGAAFFSWLNTNGGAAATDNCGAVSWSNDFSGTPPTCCEFVAVTFTATDSCGNTAMTTGSFFAEDTLSPVVTFSPNDTTITCIGTDPLPCEPPIVSPVFQDNCDTTLTVSFSASYINMDSIWIINRCWTAMDDCGNDLEHCQVITIILVDTVVNRIIRPGSFSFVQGLQFWQSVQAVHQPFREDFERNGFAPTEGAGLYTMAPAAARPALLFGLQYAVSPNLQLETSFSFTSYDFVSSYRYDDAIGSLTGNFQQFSQMLGLRFSPLPAIYLGSGLHLRQINLHQLVWRSGSSSRQLDASFHELESAAYLSAGLRLQLQPGSWLELGGVIDSRRRLWGDVRMVWEVRR